MFDRYVQRWQNRQRPVRPTYQSGQTGSPSHRSAGPYGHLVPNQCDVSTSTQPNSSSHFDQALADYKNDLANLLRESFGVDVRSKTRTYQKSYPTSFDSVAYILLVLGCLNLLNSVGEDTRSTFEHISQYLAQLGEAGSINELKMRLFSLSLTRTAFSWFSSLAPNSIGS